MSFFSKFFNKKDKFLTQDELIENVALGCPYIYKLDEVTKKNTILYIIQKINEACVMYGGNINSIKLIRIGQDACVLECNDKIIKVTSIFYGINSLSQYVSNSDSIIQPLYENICIPTGNSKDMCITIHLFDKLDTKGIGMNEAIQIYIRLREDGYVWSDPRPENIGRDKDGNLKLIDYGQIIYINDKDEYFRNNEIKVNEDNYPIYAEAYHRYIQNKEEQRHI